MGLDEPLFILGAIGKQKTVNTDTDCNTLTLTGLYFFSTSGSATPEGIHKPTANNCCVLVISGYTIIQFHIDQYGTVHLRSRNASGAWSSWTQLL